MTVNHANPTSNADTTPRLPMAALLALAMTGFLCIITETLPAGLLPQIAEGLAVSTSLAGQTVTAYALGSIVAAIPLTVATQRWRRRSVLLLTIVGFLVFNSITAVSSSYPVTLVARFLAGMAAGLGWSLLAGYARRMVPVAQQGRALAVAMVGTPIALSLGVPLGTWLGAHMGWRSAFVAASLLTLVLIVWVLAKVPDYPGQAGDRRLPLRKVFTTPGVRPVLAVVVAWMLAHNILYTYIAPFVTEAGLASQVDIVLLTFGVTSLIAIGIAGRLVDHHLRGSVLASLAGFALVASALAVAARSPAVVYAGVGIWGLTFGGAATFLQTALADTAGDGADVALSMNVMAWNGAIAGGGLVGGAALQAFGPASLPPLMVALLAIAFAIAWLARSRGFRAGARHVHEPVYGH